MCSNQNLNFLSSNYNIKKYFFNFKAIKTSKNLKFFVNTDPNIRVLGQFMAILERI